jgi:hypothetical protein
VLLDRAREEALAQGAVGDEPDPELLAGRQHRLLRAPPPQRVLALDRRDRLDGVDPADGTGRGLRHAEVLHLARRNQVGDGAGDVLDRHLGVHAVQVVQVFSISIYGR